MYNPTRDQARLFFIDAWRKHRAHESLSALENTAAELIFQHPEYHPLIEDAQTVSKDFSPEDGQVNPFLHLSLHLAIHEQLSIDQPPGIRAAYDKCLAKTLGERHDALHLMLEALGEMVYNAQRNGTAPDGAAYLENILQRASR